MAERYDLVVIGSGIAGLGVATRCRAEGWSVAVVDRLPLGGTCALRGCDPKKVLIGGAEAVDHVRRMRRHGVAGDARIDWAELMAFKRSFTDPVPDERRRQLTEQGIAICSGPARFLDAGTLAVGEARLAFQHVVIAAGAEPVPLNIPGAGLVTTSDRFLEAETLPARIALIGGGYIAGEFAGLAARAGAAVTILQRGERMLPAFDADMVDLLMRRFRQDGIDVRLGAEVRAAAQEGEGLRVTAHTAGGPLTVTADLVVHAAGRAPALADLDLAAAGIAVSDGRIALNAFLQSVSNSAVYAAGDAASAAPALTPMAARTAEAVAANLILGNHRTVDDRVVPSVAFTMPPIAAVGLSEAEARAAGRQFRVNRQNAADWYTARRLAEPVYGFKMLIEDGTDLILGAHLVGPQAEDVINLLALAMKNGLTARQVQDTVFAYPTAASDLTYMLD